MGRVEPDGMLPDFPHDAAHALVALADGARWGLRSSRHQSSRRQFCRGSVTHGTILTRIRAENDPLLSPGQTVRAYGI
jgi:hypothetical protein